MEGGEPPVASLCNGAVSGSTGTDPACTSDCAPRLVLGPSCEAVFPEARALQYSRERWRAYLPCSGWVRESPRRSGRLNADQRNRTVVVHRNTSCSEPRNVIPRYQDRLHANVYVRFSERLDPFTGHGYKCGSSSYRAAVTRTAVGKTNWSMTVWL